MDHLAKALAETREGAPELWVELKPYRFEDQYQLIRGQRRFITWGLCELFCKESARLAAIDPARAVESAELAVFISDLLREEDPQKSPYLYQLRGYAWAHDGNARRVLGDLRNADESFSIAEAWWEAGEVEVGDALGFEPVILDHKASLRIAQRRFSDAFEMLDRLYEIHTKGDRHADCHLAGRALVKKAMALGEMGEPELALGLLHQAEGLVEPQRDSRLYLCLRHNLLWDLAHTGRYEEAQEMLPGVITLCQELGNPMDMLRLRWTEGRIAAGLGRTGQAIEVLQELRQEFAERGIAYDAALITLELTALYAKEGRYAEVKELSLEMAEIFRAHEVHREGLAALLFFQQAAERERVTAKLAREIATFLEKLRVDPDLRFERRR
ncbi:MAG TPA: hypothetical protein VLE27_10610 [Thermoanaerobaculia bacterium]|nr:hypothetical protein [Thermoanaerobaculia bacterium]